MIRKYEDRDKIRVTVLGKVISPSYDVRNKSENEEILVYEKDDEIIAFIQYSKMYEVIDIIDIVVDERFRRRKIGSYFLMYLSEDISVKKFMLEVRESNYGAIKFYENNGFVSVRPIKNYYRNGENALAMEKVIR